MKIVIAGAGEVGCHLAKMLTGNYHDVTIIDDREEKLAQLRETMDVVTVTGYPTSVETLAAAGTADADLFVAVNPAKDQSVNIICAVMAKKLGARKVTARINNDEYLRSENKILFTEMGIDLMFYPEKIAADEIFGLLRQGGMSDFIDFAHGRLQMVAIRLNEGAPLVDKTLLDYVSEVKPQFRMVALTRDGETLIPQKDTIFKQGDLLFVIAKKESIPEIMAYTGQDELDIKRLTILGGGSIGELLARQFESSAEFVKIIEKDRDRCDYLSEKLDRTLVINGDGRDADLLDEEDIRSCDAFVAVTPSSETNILACVAARGMGVARTIAEVENIEYIKLAEAMGVDAVVNKKLITAGRIFRFTLSNKVRTVKVLGGSDAEVLEYVVNPSSPITKAPLRDLHFPKDAVIGGVIRGSEAIIAVGDTQIRPYDRVAVFAMPSALKQIEKFFS